MLGRVTTLTQKGDRALIPRCAVVLFGSVINQDLTSFSSLTSWGENPSITDSKRSFHLRLLSLSVKLMAIMTSAKESVLPSESILDILTTASRVVRCKCSG